MSASAMVASPVEPSHRKAIAGHDCSRGDRSSRAQQEQFRTVA